MTLKPLTLDVGGTLFKTTKVTLCAHSRFFRTLLAEADATEGAGAREQRPPPDEGTGYRVQGTGYRVQPPLVEPRGSQPAAAERYFLDLDPPAFAGGSHLLPNAYLLPPTSYLLPPTSYLLPPTSYLLLIRRSQAWQHAARVRPVLGRPLT